MKNKEKQQNIIEDIEFKKEKERVKEFLKKVAKQNCSHCFGLGQKGFNIITKEFVVCQCVQKNYKQYMEKEKKDKENIQNKVETKEIKKDNLLQKMLHKFKK